MEPFENKQAIQKPSAFKPFVRTGANFANQLLPDDELVGSIYEQNILISTLQQQNQLIGATLVELRERIQAKKAQLIAGAPSTPVVQEKSDAKDLLQMLCGRTDQFDYSLDILKEFPDPICKNKYFSFQVQLTPLNEEILQSEVRIPLCIAFYTSEYPPKLLTQNINGTKIIKGYCESVLSYNPQLLRHTAFFKIAINEVSSHFRNNWIFLVVAPRYMDRDETAQRIKPFILSELTIRAKDLTKRNKEEMTQDMEIEQDITLEDS